MRQRDVILDKTATVAPRSIQEDEIPRSGGRWPEYAHTLIVCMDRFEDGLAEGRIYSYCLPDERPFRSLDQLLFALEELMDESGLAQAWNRPRSLPSERKMRKRKKAEADLEEQEAPEQRRPPWAFQALQPARGRLASFYLRVYSRQHASMQGVLAQVDKKDGPVSFRSALELARMLRGAIDN